jgi:hypothetical protein
VADAFDGPFDGYTIWLATEGRPKSPATIRNYCYYLREMRSYARQHGLSGWEQLTRAHVRAFLGNLSVTNSAGDSSNTALGDYSAGQLVDGNFSFTNNTGRLFVGYGMQVHNFTFAGNTGTPSDYPGLSWTGSSSIS